MSRPVDRWDYDGDCQHCFLGLPHTLEAHDAALGTPVERLRNARIAAIAFQAGITDEEAALAVEEGL